MRMLLIMNVFFAISLPCSVIVLLEKLLRKCVKQIINNSYVVDNERFFAISLPCSVIVLLEKLLL